MRRAWDDYNHNCQSCWNAYRAVPQGDPCYKHKDNPDNELSITLELLERESQTRHQEVRREFLSPRLVVLEILALKSNIERLVDSNAAINLGFMAYADRLSDDLERLLPEQDRV